MSVQYTLEMFREFRRLRSSNDREGLQKFIERHGERTCDAMRIVLERRKARRVEGMAKKTEGGNNDPG